MKKNTTKDQSLRFDRIDALRGFSMIWMTLFHFSFDLNHFGFLKQNFYEDTFWTYQRTCIVSLFLVCAGLSQAIASSQNLSWSRFFKRWKLVLAASLLVSVGSYIVYPNSFIYFGILHGIALMLLILKALSKWGQHLWLLALPVLSLKFIAPIAHETSTGFEIFNQPLLNWLGFINRKPITEDYAPLVPWLAVILIGYSAGLWILKNKQHWLSAPINNNFYFLAALGKYSLSYYLIHQPVLFGIVYLLSFI
jgi:uncharacterized membrane protein